MASSPIRGKDQNCCFWTKQSDGCAQVKHGGAAIVAALVAIALVAGVLLMLAQNGHNLAGINSIAQMVEAKWIYLGMGIAGALLVIDTTLIIAQVHGHLTKTFSEDELEKRGIYSYLSQKMIADELAPESCIIVKVHADREADCPSLYAFMNKNREGQVHVVCYRTQADATHQLGRLLQDGYVDSEATEYLASEVMDAMGISDYARKQTEWSAGLMLGCYSLIDPIFLNATEQAWPLVLRTEDDLMVRFFKSADARETSLQRTYRPFRDQVVDAWIQKEYENKVLIALKSREYWTYETQYGSRAFYIVAHRTEGGMKNVDFATPEERTAYIAEQLFDAIDAKAKFNASKTYTYDEVRSLVAGGILEHCSTHPISFHEYLTQDIPMVFQPKQSVYALIAGGDPESSVLYFKTAALRQEYIDEKLKDWIDQQALKTALLGY